MSDAGYQRGWPWATLTGAAVFLAVLLGLFEALPELLPRAGTWWALLLLEVVAAGLAGLAAVRLVLELFRGPALRTPAAGSPMVPVVMQVAFWKRPWMPWALIALALLMFVAVAFALLGVVHTQNIPNELSLPVLAIAGVVALLGSLALVAVSFNLVQMSDKTQPLGLPQGSVRAVIALSLVVLFAILTVYLFSSLNTPFDQIATCLTDSASSDLLIRSRQDGTGMIRSLTASIKNCPESKTPYFDMLAPRPVSQAGTDFAKQLLVLIGTLVTSVASFYFGSQAVSQAQTAMAGLNVSPSLQGVSPMTLTPERDKDVGLDVLGAGLNGVRQVQLLNAGQQISAISVTSNEARAHARFNLPVGDAPTGPWDVMVTDSQGRSTRLPAAVTVGAAPADTAAPGDPTKGMAAKGGTGADRAADPAPVAGATAAAPALLNGLQARARDAAAVARAIKGLLPLAPDVAGAAASSQAATALALVQAAIDAPSETTVAAANGAVAAALTANGVPGEQAVWLGSALGALKEATEAAAAVQGAVDNPSAASVGTALTQAGQVLKETAGGGLGPVLADAIGTVGSVLQNPAVGALLGGVGLAVPPAGAVVGIALGAWQAWLLGVKQYQRWMARVLDRPITQDLFPSAAWDGIAARTLVKAVPAMERVFGATLDASPPQQAAGLLALIFQPDAVEQLRAGDLPGGMALPKPGEPGGFLSEAEVEEAVKAIRRLVLDQAIDSDVMPPIPLGDGQSASQTAFRGAVDQLREAGAGRAIDTMGMLAAALIAQARRSPATGGTEALDVERLLIDALAAAQARPQPTTPPEPPPPAVSETEPAP